MQGTCLSRSGMSLIDMCVVGCVGDAYHRHGARPTAHAYSLYIQLLYIIDNGITKHKMSASQICIINTDLLL